jgi:hypothetical protein
MDTLELIVDDRHIDQWVDVVGLVDVPLQIGQKLLDDFMILRR